MTDVCLCSGDVGDYEARDHGDDYLDGMVFAPNQVTQSST